MTQGDTKTGQKGTNAMFVMNQEDIKKVLATGKKFTYANPAIDHSPQKEDQTGSESQRVANLLTATENYYTAKLHWNSVVSTKSAKYMCIEIKSVYLSAVLLEYYEYMKIYQSPYFHDGSSSNNMG